MTRSLLGPADVPCVLCDRRERGLTWGDYCSACKKARQHKASRIARKASAVAALIMAVWLLIRVPPQLTPRVYAAVTVIVVYVVVRKIVWQVAMEFLPRIAPAKTDDEGGTA